jgi:hypothetical protein
MGMKVSKKLMMRPFVGPQIELQSRAADEEQSDDSDLDVDSITARRRSLSNLANGLRSLVSKD